MFLAVTCRMVGVFFCATVVTRYGKGEGVGGRQIPKEESVQKVDNGEESQDSNS